MATSLGLGLHCLPPLPQVHCPAPSLQGSDELWLRRWAAAFNVTTSATPHLEMHGFRCDDNWLQRLRETVKGKQVVGVSSFEGIVGAHVRHPGLEWRYEDVKGRQTPCQRSYVEVRAKGGRT